MIRQAQDYLIPGKIEDSFIGGKTRWGDQSHDHHQDADDGHGKYAVFASAKHFLISNSIA